MDWDKRERELRDAMRKDVEILREVLDRKALAQETADAKRLARAWTVGEMLPGALSLFAIAAIWAIAALHFLGWW